MVSVLIRQQRGKLYITFIGGVDGCLLQKSQEKHLISAGLI
jgi:hypothetical protein